MENFTLFHLEQHGVAHTFLNDVAYNHISSIFMTLVYFSGGATASGSSFGGASVSKIYISLHDFFQLVMHGRNITLSSFPVKLNMFTIFYGAEREV